MVDDHAFAGCQQALDQVWKVQVFACGDVIQNARLEEVNAHADAVVEGGLFDIASHHVIAVVLLDHAQVDVHLAFVHGDGADGALLFVEADQVVEGQQGQHVAVADHKGFIQPGNLCQGAGRAQWF